MPYICNSMSMCVERGRVVFCELHCCDIYEKKVTVKLLCVQTGVCVVTLLGLKQQNKLLQHLMQALYYQQIVLPLLYFFYFMYFLLYFL